MHFGGERIQNVKTHNLVVLNQVPTYKEKCIIVHETLPPEYFIYGNNYVKLPHND